MDPNLYHLDWERVFEVLATIVVLAFFVERALSIVFENRRIIPFLESSGLKEFIAYGVALVVCLCWDFDAISATVLAERTTLLGKVLTAGVIAGGSKASVKLFRDVLGFRSSAYEEFRAAKEASPPKMASRRVAPPRADA